MNPYRARKKIVAYAILSLLAFGTAALGAALGYSGLAQRRFLLHAGREDLALCLNNPDLDCDPRRWWVLVIAGSVLLVIGLVLLLRLGARLRRLLRQR